MTDDLFSENERTAPDAGSRQFVSVGALDCELGGHIPEVVVAYQTFGNLTPDRDNAVLICHATSGDSNVVGWWSHLVGPGKPIDTDRFFVIGNNLLGGCQGTTGPPSLHPDGLPYGSRFPRITIGDQVDVQRRLIQALGLNELYCVAGGSVGGCLAVEWTRRYPERVKKCFATASCAGANAMQIGFHEAARQAILRDPRWRGGDYGDDPPVDGLAVARMLGHLTYLSPESFESKFGRERRNDGVFQIASYLAHQGEGFTRRFDAGSFMALSYAMDDWQAESLHGSTSEYLYVSFASDWFYPLSQSQQLHELALAAGCRSQFVVSQAPYGHDSFLLDAGEQGEAVGRFLAGR